LAFIDELTEYQNPDDNVRDVGQLLDNNRSLISVQS
jgi:hypothetical protein